MYRIIALNQACCTAQKARSAKMININFLRAAKVYSILFRYWFGRYSGTINYLKNRLLQHFLQPRKHSRAARKAPRGHMRPAVRMLCRPASNAHKPKHSKTWNTVTASSGVRRKFPRWGASFVTIVWRHKPTLGEVPMARPF